MSDVAHVIGWLEDQMSAAYRIGDEVVGDLFREAANLIDNARTEHEHDAEKCFGCAEVHERALAEMEENE